MSYIFVEKKRHSNETLKGLVLGIVDEMAEYRDEMYIDVMNAGRLEYRIIQKKNSTKCYFELFSKERVNRAVVSLGRIDEAIFKSKYQEYFYCIRNYDGMSENFCKRLYPKFASFERNIRSLVLLILVEAYGSDWSKETISKELHNKIKSTAHGNVSMTSILENMDLYDLETYLFDMRDVNYAEILSEKLNNQKLKTMDKMEILQIIEQMRPTSLWQRLFSKFGKDSEWRDRVKAIHNARNQVAHQKTMSKGEYKDITGKINLLNKDIEKAIAGIRDANFTEVNKVDILGSFALIAGGVLSQNVFNIQPLRDILRAIDSRIQEIMEPIKRIYSSNTIAEIEQIKKNCVEGIDMDRVVEAQKMINSVNKNIKIPNYKSILMESDEYVNAITIAQKVSDCIFNINNSLYRK